MVYKGLYQMAETETDLILGRDLCTERADYGIIIDFIPGPCFCHPVLACVLQMDEHRWRGRQLIPRHS